MGEGGIGWNHKRSGSFKGYITPIRACIPLHYPYITPSRPLQGPIGILEWALLSRRRPKGDDVRVGEQKMTIEEYRRQCATRRRRIDEDMPKSVPSVLVPVATLEALHALLGRLIEEVEADV